MHPSILSATVVGNIYGIWKQAANISVLAIQNSNKKEWKQNPKETINFCSCFFRLALGFQQQTQYIWSTVRETWVVAFIDV